ncbi:nicotinamide-nucleotide amidohydrolase family protein [Cellulomonas sp. DKR-3]|uniref:Nicotinamide-nucleotide amidohydrolase family protein n=1 Tax=Cellulomonas fulva TaxID=2835530 RepID=A0ABS5U2Z5_9CELL|nr:CinA family protein [Cellulomonas fulva]MBT0995776.1 nicotinamide-nucleotide amidohydrolase family protein [Cellulomonas fulva]
MPDEHDADPPGDAPLLLRVLRDRGLTLAVAESLTGGMVAARLVDVPGASAVLRGGVVAYATDLKAALLGVDADLLAREGAVHPDVARQMAQGVRDRLGADVGLATTGVAGPEPQDGRAPGTVHVAVVSPAGVRVASLVVDGTRAQVREEAVRAVLALARDALAGPVG